VESGSGNGHKKELPSSIQVGCQGTPHEHEDASVILNVHDVAFLSFPITLANAFHARKQEQHTTHNINTNRYTTQEPCPEGWGSSPDSLGTTLQHPVSRTAVTPTNIQSIYHNKIDTNTNSHKEQTRHESNSKWNICHKLSKIRDLYLTHHEGVTRF